MGVNAVLLRKEFNVEYLRALNWVHSFSYYTRCGKLTSFFELSGLNENGSQLATPCISMNYQEIYLI
jgi:hypothetical protein